MALYSSFTKIIILLFLSILAVRAVRDLPKQVSSPIMKHNNVTDNGYTLVATLYPFAAQEWQGGCFTDTSGYVTYPRDFRWGYVVIQVWHAKNPWCSDTYEFKVLDQTLATETFYTFLTNPKEILFRTDAELLAAISHYGVSVYLWTNGVKGCNEKIESGFDVIKEVEETLKKL